MSDSREYNKNILLAALGTTPQIITESLYHLMVQQKISIHEIHLITTTEGENKTEKQLFDNGQGAFYRFCREYEISATQICSKFHVITDTQGQQLSDIRTPEDNRVAANYFLKIVRELTGREDSRIYATIAGGRKTMSAYLYLTMQLLGREQDMLYHVLVHPESIESNPAFYFPLKETEYMEFSDRQGKTFNISVDQIRIDMAEIPFVRLRRLLSAELLDGIEHFSDLIAMTQSSIDQAISAPKVKVDMQERRLRIFYQGKNYEVRLRPVEMVFYAFLKKGPFINKKPGDQSIQKHLLDVHQKEYAILNVTKMTFDFEAIQQMTSRINRKINEHIKNPQLRNFLKIHSNRRRGGPTYSLQLDPKNIDVHFCNYNG